MVNDLAYSLLADSARSGIVGRSRCGHRSLPPQPDRLGIADADNMHLI